MSSADMSDRLLCWLAVTSWVFNARRVAECAVEHLTCYGQPEHAAKAYDGRG